MALLLTSSICVCNLTARGRCRQMGFDAGRKSFADSLIVELISTGVDVVAYNLPERALSPSTTPGISASVRFATQ
jgi:hypothetical protein